jgi:hypothetical protein
MNFVFTDVAPHMHFESLVASAIRGRWVAVELMTSLSVASITRFGVMRCEG